MGYGLLFSFGGTFISAAGMTGNEGWCFTLIGLGGLAANPVAGILCDRRDARRLFGVHGLLMGMGVALFAVAASSLPALVVSGLCIGYGYAGAMVCAQAMIARQVAEGRQATALALQQNAIRRRHRLPRALCMERCFPFSVLQPPSLCLPGMSYRARRTAASEALGVPGPMTGVLIATSSRSRCHFGRGGQLGGAVGAAGGAHVDLFKTEGAGGGVLDDFLALGVLAKGSFAVPSFILLKAFTIMNTTQATMRKLMIAVMKAPKSMPFSVPGTGIVRPATSVPAPPVMSLMNGLMMSSVSDVTMAVNAAPMMMPTAMSITLPRLMNSLNSARRLFMVDPFLRETFCQGIMPLFCRVSIAS